MTFEAHRLTLELMDNIIDFVGSNEDLQSWALTCTSLLPRARTNLFRVVTVQEHSQILSLETLVVNSPHIRPYIIHLGAVNFLEYDPSSYPGDKLTPYIQAQFWIKILLSLKGTLRTFSIIPQRLFAGRWSEIPYPLQRALLKVSETPNFEGMDCQFFGTCRTALELLPSIRHLDLYYHEDRFTSPSSTHVYLKSLRLSFMTKVRPWVSQRKPEEDFDFSRRESLINLSQLERLVVEPNIASRVFGEDLAEDEREEDDPGAEGSHRLKCHFMSGIWLTALARPASQSLVTIYWEVGALDKDPPDLCLNELPCLDTLNIGFTYGENHPTSAHRFKTLLSFFSTRSPLPPICRCTFSLYIGDLLDPALLNFVQDLPHVESAVIGFIHQRPDYESRKYDETSKEAFALLQAAGRSRNDCRIEIVSPTQTFGRWEELRTIRPYGHVVKGFRDD